MLPKDIKKTNDIAKLPILVKQVIRRFKTFTLIAKELRISLLNNLALRQLNPIHKKGP